LYRSIFLALLGFLFSVSVFAQSGTGTLHGNVTDPSGAIVSGASVAATNASGKTVTGKTDSQGGYHISGLEPGTYSVGVTAKGFAPFVQSNVQVAPGQDQKVDAALDIAVQQQELNVQAQGTTVSVDPENNANTVVLKGKDLEALSDDPDELQSELQALAGPAAGPSGGQVYIDGFTGGQLPPKSSIREIRINSNPFSPEYDKLGYGRIEILTKPGSDAFHGQAFVNYTNGIFDAKNPFAVNSPGFQVAQGEANVSGPISKKASFFFNIERRNTDDVSSIVPGCPPSASALCLPSTLANPRVRTEISPRFDYQVTPMNTLAVRYQYEGYNDQNDGVGQTALASQAYNAHGNENTFQITDTQVLKANTVNETRFQYSRTRDKEVPLNFGPTFKVQGVFTDGGNSRGTSIDDESHYEVQNFTSIVAGVHTFKVGGRFRAFNTSQIDNSNFNGTFTFDTFTDYQKSIASQYSVNQGHDPNVVAHNVQVTNLYLDAGLYAQDDWRLRPNMTLSYGLRYEIQSDLDEHHDFAPRVSFAWGLGKSKSSPKTVLRAGAGIFYDRFGQSQILNNIRLNEDSPLQDAFIVNGPIVSPNVPSNLTRQTSLLYRLNSNLSAPYIMQEAIGVEQQLAKNATLAVTFLNSRGVHQLFTSNINVQQLFPNTFNPNEGAVYQYQSGGIFKQQQVIANFNLRANQRFFVFAFYTLNFAKSDTAGPNSFPLIQNNAALDFGPTAFDVRNRLFLGGSVLAPYGFRISPFMMAASGQPYNITLGPDLNGDTVFNDRPALIPGCDSATTVSCFVPPVKGAKYPPAGFQIVGPYFGGAPPQFTLNVRFGKTFGVGPRKSANAGPQGGGERGGGGGERRGFGGFGGMGGGGMRAAMGGGGSDRRYSLSFNVFARNLFNNVNLATPSGVLTSPSFGRSTALAGGFGGPGGTQASNRRIDLQVMFAF